ncbi:MAG: S8 family serine peptidase [Caldilineaceae bacterium]
MSRCPGCQQSTDPRILAQSAQVRLPLARHILASAPAWRPEQGICPTCVQRYADAFATERSLVSLHTSTEPHTTFPYYHSAEESVASQRERLPAYHTFTGSAVTIAFLDSGYYPHPDLVAGDATWPIPLPTWSTLTPQQWHDYLYTMPLRLANYVDLTDGGERVGLTQASLWDGAGDSWHGQMTTTIAAGSGWLSDGRYRGYAADATILPIKIGRGGGRIPEADILRGLQWLLRDDNWARYNVRVVNVSVGGDFVQDWRENPVCRAALALAERGVLVAAAAGNSGAAELKAPAQAPTVLTVGGVDDQNRPWSLPTEGRFSLYPHNYGAVTQRRQRIQKPEVLALARWLPAPILPVSPILREMYAIGALRSVLLGYPEQGPLSTTTWNAPGAANPMSRTDSHEANRYRPPAWMPEVWYGVRQRMNAHKWIHPYYQQVDGTSVAVAQVSALAAQMVEANPQLTVEALRAIIQTTALPLPYHPAHLTGAGLIQPALAVATALRTHGPLSGFPLSATRLGANELQKWRKQGRVPFIKLTEPSGAPATVFYLGLFAPQARAVSVVGDFNQWQPGVHALRATQQGWWHGLFGLGPGVHAYRFWVEDAQTPQGRWLPDPENPHRQESGYIEGHSVLTISTEE